MSDASRIIIAIGKFAQVLEAQLQGVRRAMSDTVQTVMDGVMDLTRATGEKAKEAEAVLERTYFSPDQQTQDMVSRVQDDVDDLIAAAKGEGPGLKPATVPSADELRHFSASFSRNMEALNLLDARIGKLLVQMMGALSNDDVIGQRLDHIEKCLHNLVMGLAALEPDFSTETFERFRAELLATTYRAYAMEDEKLEYKRVFGSPTSRRTSAG